MKTIPLLRRTALAALLLASTAAPLAADTGAAPQVTIRQGALKGAEADGVRKFLNIPFGASTAGERRWKAPVAASGWSGLRDATQFGPICPQWRPPVDQRPMSEDCLSVNVWAPAAHKGPLPVMVWIYGGGFLGGSNREPAYDGTALAKMGVVLVTLNYRVGPLGFMAHPGLTAEAPYKASGNYGILDQIEGLKWVRDNIAAFGGDPGNVTVFGESAGSTAISILQASPLAKGLFHRAIGESTSQFDPDGGLVGRKEMREAEAYGSDFGRKLGGETVAQLRALPMDAFTKELAFFWPTERDGYVLPDIVYNIFAAGKQNDVPTLVGSNSMEGSNIRKDWVQRSDTNGAAYDRIYGASKDQLGQSSTDAVQWQMRSWAKLQAKTGKSGAWLYWFDQPWPGKPEMGAFHSAEIVYVFRNLQVEDQPWTPEDHKLSDLVSHYWVNFARTGNPNGPGLPEWPRYDDTAPKLMRLSPQPAVIGTPRAEAQAFLDSYFDARR
ncbi:para-nitrobenzyl esterase [Sphingobium sp. B2D3A]|uniref:carboxylesterase/lipase family protein n=1 Tax=unclassified Sphingobium TaxID=2611147 RepID=UPI0022252B01|nr:MULTISPECIES: carboxylesterase family protein [unclassified Sphingobium]MCW2338583.1 para-nitrobenzyl esterase [Sphingobium sp. B2D3A]MCW2385041.1 para-nitrobenzyl esterase [Sphingobium sp. B2D3D]